MINFYNEVVNEEKHQLASDYILIIDTLGYFDGFYIASFSRGEDAEKRGAEMYRRAFGDEVLILEKAIITDTLIGYLPLHIDSFEVWKKRTKIRIGMHLAPVVCLLLHRGNRLVVLWYFLKFLCVGNWLHH